MAEPTHKKVEVVGTSSKSFSEAADNAIKKASETLQNLEWFEVTEMSGRVGDGRVSQYQVTMKIGFRLN
jgi:flavin-binding protein dodecin